MPLVPVLEHMSNYGYQRKDRPACVDNITYSAVCIVQLHGYDIGLLCYPGIAASHQRRHACAVVLAVKVLPACRCAFSVNRKRIDYTCRIVLTQNVLVSTQKGDDTIATVQEFVLFT